MPITENVNLFPIGSGVVHTVGFPLKESFAVTDVSTLRLKHLSTVIPATFTVGARWKGLPSDATKALKWVFVTFKDTTSPRTLTVDDSGASVPATVNPLVVTNNTNDIVVSNGLLSVTINKTANSPNLLTSASFAGTERLHAANKPRLTVPVDKKTLSTWTDSQFDFAANAGDIAMKVENASIYSAGDTLHFAWEGEVLDYYPTGGADSHPFIIMKTPFPIAQMTRALMTTHRPNIIINPGGSQVIVPIDFSDNQGFCLLSAPGITPTPGMKIRLQDVDTQPDLTIDSINTGTNVITFTAAFTKYMPQGVDVLPLDPASSTAGMCITGTTIERQYGDKRIIVRQDGVLKDLNNGTRLYDTLKFEARHILSCDIPFVITALSVVNAQDVATNPECGSVYFRALNFELPLATASTTVSDEVLDEDEATLRYNADMDDLHVALTHSAIANFQVGVHQFNVEYPNKLKIDASGALFEIFPSGGAETEFHGSSRKTRYFVWGINAADAFKALDEIGITYDAVYTCATKGTRPNLVEKRNWSAGFTDIDDLAIRDELREAANRYERMAATPYDITACENVSGARPAMTLKEYRTEYPARAGANSVMGWEKFGNTNEDVGFGNNRYSLGWILLREGLRETNAAKARQAFRLALQQIRNRVELGQYWSHKNFNNVAGLDLYGMARYERAYAPDPFNYTNQMAPTHSWNEDACAAWALTDDPIFERAAKAGADQAAVYNYQGTYGARLFGTGAYQMKDPGTGKGDAEPRYVGWPILNLVVAYRYFGNPLYLQRAIDYAQSFIATQAAESQNDGFIDFVGTDDTIRPLFQHGGYCMHGIIELHREVSGTIQNQLATYIGKVANFLYKGDQRLADVGPDSPLLAGGRDHPNDPTKYNPAIYFPFSYKRSFAASLTAGINASVVSIPVDDTSTFLLGNNGDYGNPAPSAVGILITDINDVTTWEYFKYTGKSTASGAGNLTGVTRAFGASGAKTFPSGAIVYPLGMGGALNDVVIATLIAGARVTGTQQLQDYAQRIWIDNCFYRDEYTTDNPAFVLKSARSPINFWPKNVGSNAPKLTAQTLIGASEFLGDFTTPQPIPTIADVSPTVLVSGSGAQIITLTGVNYEEDSIVRANAEDLTTTFVSATELTATIPDSLTSSPQTLSLHVINPSSGNQSGSVSLVVAAAPEISSLFPDTKNAGEASFVLIVNGTNFQSNSTVSINGTNRTTTYVSPSRLDVQILAGDIASAGNKSVVVTNPSNGLQSAAATLAVAGGGGGGNPTPVLASISPTSKTAGDAQFVLTVNGSSFVNGAIVRIGGVDRATTFVSSSQLTAVILAGDVASAGSRSITVFNPSPGGGASAAQTFTVNAPVVAPTISSISPTSKTVGDAQFVLTVNGANFDSDAVVRVNGSDRATTFVSSSQLTAVILAGDLASAAALSVTVRNVGAAQTSQSATLTVSVAPNPAPTTSSLSPTTAVAGAGQLTLTVNGAGFISSSVIHWNGQALTTTFVSSSQLTATISSTLLETAGSANVTVSNPTPGGGTSSALTFSISALAFDAPTLTSLAPTSSEIGSAPFTLTVNGANFQNGAVVYWNGHARSTTYVNANKLLAQIMAADQLAQGTANVSVQNPDNQTSGSLNFTITRANNPIPTTTGVVPQAVPIGAAGMTLTVTGTNFRAGAVARINGNARPTTVVSDTTLRVVLSSGDASAPAALVLTVENPAPTLGASAPLVVQVANNGVGQPLLAPGLETEKTTWTIRQGDTFRSSTSLSIGGVALNLTGVTARLQFRTGFAQDAPLILKELTTENGGIAIDPFNGRLTFFLSATETSEFRFKRARFDCELTAPDTTVVTILEGIVRITPEVTR